MALVAIAADKGAPGVTTAAVALAAVWPGRVVLAECDVAGGDLPYRLPAAGGAPLSQTRGVVSLATAVRGAGTDPEVVWEHVQELDGGLPVLVGPTQPEQAAAMSTSWAPISGVLAGMADADVLVDCGRVLGETPVAPMLRRAGLILLVARPTVEGVAHLRHGLAAVARAANAGGVAAGGSALQRIAVVLVGEQRQEQRNVREVREALEGAPGLGGVPVLGQIAYDERGAAGLRGQWGRRLDRTPLIASARTVAGELYSRVNLPAPPGPVELPSPSSTRFFERASSA